MEKKIIAVDFDGVLAFYNGWKGVDWFGEPIVKNCNLIRKLYKEGNYITIWTTREDTPELRNWLHKNKVPYNSINSTDHNPPGTSNKPIYHVFLDDRAINVTSKSEPLIIYDRIQSILAREI